MPGSIFWSWVCRFPNPHGRRSGDPAFLHAAVRAGTSLSKVLDMVRELRRTSQIPIVVFSYDNPILAYALGPLLQRCSKCRGRRVAGGGSSPRRIRGNDLHLDRKTNWASHPAPGADLPRPSAWPSIAEKASGFLYLVSMTGVTGSAGLESRRSTPES